ncbi:hypothetical protein [Novosphingobium resinovorum]|uniref:hypothetical protein n=1 Tax=Novosphingobium resinovorum TaxID=158500 RepID=UPI002ED53E1E|nr:hypothetical protein [Novosphingobium resinovorum]
MQSELVRAMPLPPALTARRPARGPWLRLLSEVLALAGPSAEFLRHSERNWASATFSGARHTIVLAFEGLDGVARGEALIAALPDHEFTVPRHLVADAVVAGVEHRQSPPRLTVEVELLVLEDC